MIRRYLRFSGLRTPTCKWRRGSASFPVSLAAFFLVLFSFDFCLEARLFLVVMSSLWVLCFCGCELVGCWLA